MKTCKQLLLSVACLALMVGVVRAADEKENDDEFVSKISSGENVVLFKIHDITPLKNEDGVVSDCEFSLTLYNRSPKNIDAATMRLSWTDEGVSDVIDEEDKKSIEEIAEQQPAPARRVRGRRLLNDASNVQKPKTEDFVSRTLATSVALPKIKPFRQVSLKSKIKSDRCFLMMTDAVYSFTTCNITSAEDEKSSRRSFSSRGEGDTACQSLFRFVSPRDPEYYREFQKVSFNEEAQQKKEARAKDIKEMQESYESMMRSLTLASDALKSIH